MQRFFDTHSNKTLKPESEQLLNKLIYFDCLTVDLENDPVKHELYDLFF